MRRSTARAMRRAMSGQAIASTFLFLLTMIVCGCSSEKTNVCLPEVPAGRIEGTVRAGMSVPKLAIVATRIPMAGQNTVVEDAGLDASGHYHIDVPAGVYQISLEVEGRHYYSYSRAGLLYRRAAGDTIRVDEAHSPVTADFDLGAVRVTMSVPPELNGEDASVILVRRGGHASPGYDSAANRGYAQIQNGSIAIVVPCVIPGSYKMEMNIAYRDYACICVYYDGEHFWLPATRDSSQAPWTDVPTNTVTDAVASLEMNPARIEGEVVGAWQTLRRDSPPYVSIVTPESTVVIGSRTVADDGSFGINVFLPTPVKIKVSEDGFERWIGGRSFADAQVLDLEHGQTVSGLRLVQSGLQVNLGPDSTQFDTDFGEARVYDPATGRQIGVYQPPIVTLGRSFGIANLAPGSYFVHIGTEYPGSCAFLAQWYDRAASIDAAQVITIPTEGDIVPVPVTLVRGGSISGAIVNGQAGGYLAYFTSPDDPRTSGFWFVVTQTYKIQGLENGDYKVGAWRNSDQFPSQPPASTVWYPGTTDWGAAQVISIRNHEAVTGMDITFP